MYHQASLSYIHFQAFSFCLIYEERFFSSKQFLLQNNWLNNRCYIRCDSKCGQAKVFLQVFFEVWIFVACIVQQNQTDLISLHVVGNKINRQKTCKTKLFSYGRLWGICNRFVKSIFLLQSHKKIAPCSRGLTVDFNFMVNIFPLQSELCKLCYTNIW